MLKVELQIEEGSIVINPSEESADSLKDELEMERVSNKALAREGDKLQAEITILKERNKTAVGRCVTKQEENDRLCDMHTSQRREIETYVKQIKEAKATIRLLKYYKDKLKQQPFAKYYPTDGQLEAEKERDELQTRLDILEARKAEAIEHLRL